MVVMANWKRAKLKILITINLHSNFKKISIPLILNNSLQCYFSLFINCFQYFIPFLFENVFNIILINLDGLLKYTKKY
mgnify:FL=1